MKKRRKKEHWPTLGQQYEHCSAPEGKKPSPGGPWMGHPTLVAAISRALRYATSAHKMNTLTRRKNSFLTSQGPLGAVLFSGYGPGPSKIDTLGWFLAGIINPDINFDLGNRFPRPRAVCSYRHIT